MNVIQITPGAGGMFCGGCFRDNALVAALRRANHHALMVPLYLPLTLEDEDTSAGVPIFFSGINVYLEQKLPFFRQAPRWLHDFLARRDVLKWAAGSAARTRPADVGALTISMIRGEAGAQARELDELVQWLQAHEKPQIICLSNALLVGLARRLKRDLGVPVICTLQGEDFFLDNLNLRYRDLAWRALAERAADVDLFVAPSEYFRARMAQRLQLAPEQVRVVHNGIPLDGFFPAGSPPRHPTIGYFARMCREKGLESLIEAFIILKKEGRVPGLQLRVGGGLSPADAPFVHMLRRRLRNAGWEQDAVFLPNLDRAAKQDFFRSLSVLSVPALYGEAFGLYVLEALACRVPVVQPRHAAFPELIEATGGGLIAEANDVGSLAHNLERLLLDRELAERLGNAGREKVLADFSIEAMAARMIEVYQEVIQMGAVKKGLAEKATWLAQSGSSG